MRDSQPLNEGDLIRVDAKGWGLTWAVRKDGRLAQIGLGLEGHLSTPEAPLDLYPLAYRTWGATDPFREAALRVTHANGTLTTRMRAQEVERNDCDGGEQVIVRSRDEMFDFILEHHFRTHDESRMIEEWVEIEHDEDGPVRLYDYDSLCHFFLAGPEAEICQFGGSGWAGEWRWTTERLQPGIRSLASLGGVQPHLQRSPMLMVCPDGPSAESAGATIGMSIAWGGNTRFHLDVRPKLEPGAPAELVVKAGANPYGADYLLDPGVRFVTPTVASTWADGRTEMSDRFHTWTRRRVLREPERRRPIVANNWEATFFNFDEKRIKDLIRRSVEIGAEVFLLDDGWFGTEFPRDDDHQGLGDWEVDTTKLPCGLAGLGDAADEAGIRFGIWVEPEMINPRSRLYSEHPDWVVRDDREPAEHRSQLLLDALLEPVRDFEVAVVDRTLAAAPSTSYVKWDANRPMTDPGSRALAADRQSNTYIDSVWRTWEVMKRVAEAHPEVELMLCASGGGRNDHGTLRWFHEFWTSDNTDPVARLRMQWACSHFFPASVMAAHVTRWGGRPLGFACAVALSGRFGIDLDLASLSSAETETLRKSVQVARRTQDLVQMGRLVRLHSPVEGADMSRAALAHVSESSERSVLFMYQIEEPPASATVPSLSLDWLDDDRWYQVQRATFSDSAQVDAEKIMTGRQLRSDGIEWTPLEMHSAAVIEFTAV